MSSHFDVQQTAFKHARKQCRIACYERQGCLNAKHGVNAWDSHGIVFEWNWLSCEVTCFLSAKTLRDTRQRWYVKNNPRFLPAEQPLRFWELWHWQSFWTGCGVSRHCPLSRARVSVARSVKMCSATNGGSFPAATFYRFVSRSVFSCFKVSDSWSVFFICILTTIHVGTTAFWNAPFLWTLSET